jgi:enamine deaminase RidA (YjgF/YER057c/UK114 family)
MTIRALRPKGLGQPLGMYSHGVEADGLVVVAGQVGVTPDGGVAGPDVAAQTRQVFENIAAVLGAAGCTMRDVVRLQTFLVSADDIPGFMAARQEVFPRHFPGGVYPPNTLLVISRLVRPELRVEVEALAVKPTRKGASGPARAGAKPARRTARRR